jgi:hypothetical protein
LPILLLTVLLGLSGCSVRKIAIKKLGDALAESGATFASDNDPELVRQALPFSLKLIESLLAESPDHRGLLFAASSYFTQYAYAFAPFFCVRAITESADWKPLTRISAPH